MKSVAVLMSTYNGEKYLREQIDSILQQEYVAVYLFVRDDGSIDKTKDILEEYSRLSNVSIVFGENMGAGPSFITQLYDVGPNFDYYAFSDQDDVWEKDKICSAINVLQKTNKGLYASDLMCVDATGKQIGLKNNKNLSTEFLTILSGNLFSGCTQVFTNEMYRILTKNKVQDMTIIRDRYHDTWVAAVASLSLGIVYDRNSYIKYRIHNENVVGLKKTSRIEKLFDKKKRNLRSRLAKQIITVYPYLVRNYEYREIVSGFAHADKIYGRVKLIKNNIRYHKFHEKESCVGFGCKIFLGVV